MHVHIAARVRVSADSDTLILINTNDTELGDSWLGYRTSSTYLSLSKARIPLLCVCTGSSGPVVQVPFSKNRVVFILAKK